MSFPEEARAAIPSVQRLACLIGVIGLTALTALTAHAAAAARGGNLAHARAIRAETTVRYAHTGAPRLAVTESSSTRVVESFTLMSPDLMEQRILPADNGVYYAICPRGAMCPYPARRFARSAADFLPRRIALELAVRTFLETPADLVAVSVPTRRFVLFVVQRDDLAQAVDLAGLAWALNGDPTRATTATLLETVDRITRPRLFVGLGLMPTPGGRESWMGIACWPSPS